VLINNYFIKIKIISNKNKKYFYLEIFMKILKKININFKLNN